MILALLAHAEDVAIPADLWTVGSGEVVWTRTASPMAPEGVSLDGVQRDCQVRLVIDPEGAVRDVRPKVCAEDVLGMMRPTLLTWRAVPVQADGHAVWAAVDVPATLGAYGRVVSWMDAKPKHLETPVMPDSVKGVKELSCLVRLTIDAQGVVTAVDRRDCDDRIWDVSREAALKSTFTGVGAVVQFDFKYKFRGGKDDSRLP